MVFLLSRPANRGLFTLSYEDVLGMPVGERIAWCERLTELRDREPKG